MALNSSLLHQIRPKNGAHQDLPKFHNLTTLLLDDCDLTGEVYNLLDLFLYNAPNLEKLTLQNCKVTYISSLNIYHLPS
jgi:hypothetical protein